MYEFRISALAYATVEIVIQQPLCDLYVRLPSPLLCCENIGVTYLAEIRDHVRVSYFMIEPSI